MIYAIRHDSTGQILFAASGRVLSRHELDLLETYLRQQFGPPDCRTVTDRVRTALDQYAADTSIRLEIPDQPPVGAVITV